MRRVWGCIPASSAATEMTKTARFLDRAVMATPSCQKGLEVRAHVGGVGGRQLLEELLLVLGQSIRHLDLVPRQQVAGLAPASGEPAALDAEHLSTGRPRRDLDLHRAVHGGHGELRSQGRLGVADRDRDGQVVTAAAEDRVGSHVDLHQQVAGGTTVASRLALARNPDGLPVLDTGGNPNPDRSGADFHARAPAHAARVLDQDTCATALGAGFGEGKESLVAGNRTRPAASGAGDRPAGRLRTGATAVGTRRLSPHLEGGGDAGIGLVERDRQIGGGVGAAYGPSRPRSAAAEQVAEPAETSEQVGQVLDPHLLTTEAAEPSGPEAATAEGAARCQPPDLVVFLALFRIGEDRVRLGDVLEALLRRLVARVGVGVELLGELAVGALDLVLARVGRDLQDRVEVLLHPVAVHVSRPRSRTRGPRGPGGSGGP